jgi:putative FmdB family regulatory protein
MKDCFTIIGRIIEMPIYEYQCAACAHHFERVQKMTDAPTSTCPECGAEKVEKLMSTGAFHLKGGGWYADGYSKEKKKTESCEATKSSDCGGCPAAT